MTALTKELKRYTGIKNEADLIPESTIAALHEAGFRGLEEKAIHYNDTAMALKKYSDLGFPAVTHNQLNRACAKFGMIAAPARTYKGVVDFNVLEHIRSVRKEKWAEGLTPYIMAPKRNFEKLVYSDPVYLLKDWRNNLFIPISRWGKDVGIMRRIFSFPLSLSFMTWMITIMGILFIAPLLLYGLTLDPSFLSLWIFMIISLAGIIGSFFIEDLRWFYSKRNRVF